MKKMHFTLQLIIHLIVQSRGAPEGTFDGAPKDAFSDLHKDAQEDACEVAPKGVIELHLWLHLLIQLLMRKCIQNGSSIKDAPLNLKFGSLGVLCILYRAEQTELLTFQN